VTAPLYHGKLEVLAFWTTSRPSLSNITLFLILFRLDDGLAFVIKDIEKFASSIIPLYFNHTNFSSFVRQLNFYGFRKIKSGSLRIKDALTKEESKYWKFRHEKFQRDRPDLLSQIRKNSAEVADKKEVKQLKSEISDLHDAMSTLNYDVIALKALVECLLKSQGSPKKKRKESMKEDCPVPVLSHANLAEASFQLLPPTSGANASWLDMRSAFDGPCKKQKRSHNERMMAFMSDASLTPLPFASQGSMHHRPMHSGSGANENWTMDTMSPSVPPGFSMSRYGSDGASHISLDEGIMASLLALSDED
jgi:HSF-type DNA-binding